MRVCTAVSDERGLGMRLGRLSAEVGVERVVLCIDQNMDYDEGSFKGTALCTELRTLHQHEGVIIILTADDDDECQARHIAAGADASVYASTAQTVNRCQSLVPT